jgi:hypothetical protein
VDGKQLDLVFTTDPVNFDISKSVLELSKLDPLHPPVDICFELEALNSVQINNYYNRSYDFRNFDSDALRLQLKSIDFDSLWPDDSVDQCVLSFYDAIGTCFERVLSFVQNKPKETKAPWMTNELRNLKNRRNAAWKRYSKTQSFPNYYIFMERFNLVYDK